MTFNFELCSPEKVIFEGKVTHVALPAEEGDMVVLDFHTPINTLVRAGVIHVGTNASKDKVFFVRGASLIVRSDHVRLLAETILDLETLDVERLEKQLKAAEEDVHDAKTDQQKKTALKKQKALKEIHDALGRQSQHHHDKQHKHS
jgi:F-type H+-transporting ATPase subunit epsilon